MWNRTGGSEHARHLAVDQQDVVRCRRVGLESRVVPQRVRHRQNREIPLREREALRLAVNDVNAKRREQAQDAPRLDSARRIVVPRDHDDDRVGQRVFEPAELLERVNDGGIRRPNGVKHVAGDQHEIGRDLDDLVDRPPERRSDVRLALVDTSRRLPLVLPVAEVQVG